MDVYKILTSGIPALLMAFGLGWYTCHSLSGVSALEKALSAAQTTIKTQKITLEEQDAQRKQIEELLQSLDGEDGPIAPIYLDGINRMPVYGEAKSR